MSIRRSFLGALAALSAAPLLAAAPHPTTTASSGADFLDALFVFVLATFIGLGVITRVSRLLRSCGYRVTATDPVPAFVEAAREADSADAYAVAPASRLPFADGQFDLAVAYNMLMDVEDVPGAVREIRRVLRPAGTLLVSIVHPLADCGRFEDAGTEARFVLTRPYFGRQRFEGTETRDGLRMRFAGWSQPLEAYAAEVEREGLPLAKYRTF